jgi:epoxyqueuosine reductase
MHANENQSMAILAKAASFPGVRAGIARLEAVLKGLSYSAETEGDWNTSHYEDDAVQWLEAAESVLVLGLHHPEDDLRLDWWEKGNTWGNRRLIEISKQLQTWLQDELGLRAQPLPYHLEKGGLFLKDAAVLSGLGRIGRNNLLLHPEWGPRIRMRSLLIEGNLSTTAALTGALPCDACEEYCIKACPQAAFPGGVYSRPRCLVQMNFDREHPVPEGAIGPDGKPNPVIQFCRECELACPVGSDLTTSSSSL